MKVAVLGAAGGIGRPALVLLRVYRLCQQDCERDECTALSLHGGSSKPSLHENPLGDKNHPLAGSLPYLYDMPVLRVCRDATLVRS